VLAAVERIDGFKKTVILAFGTDGIDGMQPRRRQLAGYPPIAGAVADDTVLARARGMGINPRAFLVNNDSYSFFEALGGQIVTGPTNTNVNDLYLMLLF
jgi:glycerate-2-kinase